MLQTRMGTSDAPYGYHIVGNITVSTQLSLSLQLNRRGHDERGQLSICDYGQCKINNLNEMKIRY